VFVCFLDTISATKRLIEHFAANGDVIIMPRSCTTSILGFTTRGKLSRFSIRRVTLKWRFIRCMIACRTLIIYQNQLTLTDVLCLYFVRLTFSLPISPLQSRLCQRLYLHEKTNVVGLLLSYKYINKYLKTSIPEQTGRQEYFFEPMLNDSSW
jgi:hypothetical protein